MTADIRRGFRSYSFHSNISTGEMTLFDVIDWVAASEGEHLELASLSDAPSSPIPNIASDPAFVDEVRAKAESAGVVLSNLAVGADFFTEEPDEHAQQVARVKSRSEERRVGKGWRRRERQKHKEKRTTLREV